MVSSKDADTPVRRRRPPARTPEARENQLIDKAVTLVEKQIEEGTASSQVLTHYLKLGTTRNRLEETKLRLEIEKQQIQNDDYQRMKEREESYENVLAALTRYQGGSSDYDA